jgi:hypothetical protein
MEPTVVSQFTLGLGLHLMGLRQSNLFSYREITTCKNSAIGTASSWLSNVWVEFPKTVVGLRQ